MGVEVLIRGGNAVDAAISAMLCTGVVNMFSSGIGGGGSMVVRIPPGDDSSSSDVWSINFRETAPALSNQTMYKNNPMGSRIGGLAVGIPGELKGLEEAHKRWGTLPWKELVEPSAKLAEGWKVQRELARRIQIFGELMLDHPDWRPLFAPQGVLLEEGDWVNRTNYSRTLYTIAEHGSDAFYQGPIADALVKKIRQTEAVGGNVPRKEDFYDSCTGGRNTAVFQSVLLQMFNVLENYDMSARTPLAVHRLVETMKFAFASRTRMNDPITAADHARIAKMATKEYAKEIVRNITDDRTHPPEYYHPAFDVKMDHGTSHVSVVDRNGMAVSVTSTVNSMFGSKVLDTVTGINLNDEMDDFSVPGVPNDFGLWPSPYNYPAPGKMPVSSTSPGILENADGSFYASIGGSGGGQIFPSMVQVLLNLDWGLHVSDAVEFGRLHDQLYPLHLYADEIYPPDVLRFLRQVDHNVTGVQFDKIGFCVVQVIMQKDDIFYAASDSRKNGVAAGY
ncbi:Gamma-glutamyltranspeptidase 1 [Leucoagaricus sp. SymC.cos]|nr:Gamma-glutamyltranspeptidase 1 [Leucoagaricus sp. SymC.cos]